MCLCLKPSRAGTPKSNISDANKPTSWELSLGRSAGGCLAVNALQSQYWTTLSVHPWCIGCWLTTGWSFGAFKSSYISSKTSCLPNCLAARKCGCFMCLVFAWRLQLHTCCLYVRGGGSPLPLGSPVHGRPIPGSGQLFGWAAFAHWTAGLGLRNAGKTSKALPPFLHTLPRCVNTWDCQREADSLLLQGPDFSQAFLEGEKQVSSEAAVLYWVFKAGTFSTRVMVVLKKCCCSYRRDISSLLMVPDSVCNDSSSSWF